MTSSTLSRQWAVTRGHKTRMAAYVGRSNRRGAHSSARVWLNVDNTVIDDNPAFSQELPV